MSTKQLELTEKQVCESLYVCIKQQLMSDQTRVIDVGVVVKIKKNDMNDMKESNKQLHLTDARRLMVALTYETTLTISAPHDACIK